MSQLILGQLSIMCRLSIERVLIKMTIIDSWSSVGRVSIKGQSTVDGGHQLMLNRNCL